MSLNEAEAKAFLECTRILSTYYRRNDVTLEVTERLLAMLAVRWTRKPIALRLVLE
jgi:hypothetical protein